MTPLWRASLVRTAGAALALCVATLGGALWRAIRLDAVAAAAPATSEAMAGVPPAPRAVYPADRAAAAVGKDPFHPERRRPGRRFEVPGGGGGGATARAPRPAPSDGAVAIRLIGVTAGGSGSGGSAICQPSGGSARLVRVGERVGGWTLTRVLPGAAEFQTPAGRTVTLRIPKAGT